MGNINKYEYYESEDISEKDEGGRNNRDYLSTMKLNSTSDNLIPSESHCLSEMEDDPKISYGDLNAEIVSLTRLLIEAFDDGYWPVIERLSSKDLSYFGPDTTNTRVHGLKFHQFQYMNDSVKIKSSQKICTERSQSHMSEADVNVLSYTTAFISYTNVVQNRNKEGGFRVTRYFETRLWQRDDAKQWKCVHHHKTEVGTAIQNDKQSSYIHPISHNHPRASEVLHKNETTSSIQSLQNHPYSLPNYGSIPMEVDICQQQRSLSIIPSGSRLRTSKKDHVHKKRRSKYAEVVSIGSDVDG